MVKGLVSISSDDLKKSDKSGLKTLYLYWLENGKPTTFDLPLFVDTNGKGVLSMECFKRIFYAFCIKTSTAFECEIISGDDGDDGSYNVVRVSERKGVPSDASFLQTVNFMADFEEPKKTDQKRESSKATREKSKAKKDEAKKEADKLADDFAKTHAKKIADLVMGKYGLKLTAEKLTALENDLIAILKM